ncbi:Fatty acid-binding protein 1 [Eumeta japonica]|uniref:Fatty acid-binding protein 1 n=1 Tax=Eumeta variegata TaxID=151549 RepID=A0A4C1XXJ4_EUMVA|nr:Fatty acid-binding protein 1 [Eumeta japonica]
MLACESAVFSFGMKDDGDTYTFTLERDGKVLSSEFRSGQEHEQRRRDGRAVRVTYTVDLEANIINQVINQEDGKVVHFRREFGDGEVKLTINHQDSDVTACIYYEAVQ